MGLKFDTQFVLMINYVLAPCLAPFHGGKGVNAVVILHTTGFTSKIFWHAHPFQCCQNLSEQAENCCGFYSSPGEAISMSLTSVHVCVI